MAGALASAAAASRRKVKRDSVIGDLEVLTHAGRIDRAAIHRYARRLGKAGHQEVARHRLAGLVRLGRMGDIDLVRPRPVGGSGKAQ